jgi:hypothetical protein
MGKYVDLTGQRFGILVVAESASRKAGRIFYKCLCDCGNVIETRKDALTRGRTKSCGNCPNKAEHLPNGITVLTLERKDGTTVSCFLDTVDYPRVKNHRWHVSRDERLEKNRRWPPYVQTNVLIAGKKNMLRMHELLFGKGADHRNHNGLDNRRENLREADTQKNNWNLGKSKAAKSSIYKGVSWHKQCQKWSASIHLNDKKTHLGLFDSEVEAALAYDAEARRRFGKFAALNFPAFGEQSAGVRLDDGEDTESSATPGEPVVITVVNK